jgi:hypothetical protein
MSQTGNYENKDFMSYCANIGAEIVPEWSPTDISDVKVIVKGNGHGLAFEIRKGMALVMTTLLERGKLDIDTVDMIMQTASELGYKNESQNIKE